MRTATLVIMVAVNLAKAHTMPAATSPCNGHGMVTYIGPEDRHICTCDMGWKGNHCHTPFSKEDYGAFKICNRTSSKTQCEAGLQCDIWTDFGTLTFPEPTTRCTCTPGSENTACTNPNAWVACSYAGCEPGLECKNGSCQCLRGSKNPSCRCSGNFVDPNNGDSYACKTGKDGVCVSKDGNGRLCIYSPVSLASGSAVDACPPGKELNSLAQCVCMPLSINADCVQKAPSNADASNVCAKFQRGCEDTYMVNYAVLRGTKEITKGISKVEPVKNYLIVTDEIVADDVYELCVVPVGNWTVDRSLCDKASKINSDYGCCIEVTSSQGPANFSNGCASYQEVYSLPDGDC